MKSLEELVKVLAKKGPLYEYPKLVYKKYKAGGVSGYQGWIEDENGTCIGFISNEGEIQGWNETMDSLKQRVKGKNKQVTDFQINPSQRYPHPSR